MSFWTSRAQLPEGTAGVPIFSGVHLLWLSAVLLLCGGAVLMFRRLHRPGRERALRIAAGAMVFLLLFRLVLLIVSGTFDPSIDLPLHLCDLMVFVEFLTVFEENRSKKITAELCWCLGLPGALFALVTPGETRFPFWNIYYLVFILLHALLFLIPLLLAADGFRPSIRRLPKCFLLLLAAAAGCMALNRLFSGNYLFLNRAPAGSILEVLQQAAGALYLPAVMLLVWAVWGVQYGLGYLIFRLKRKTP